MTVIACISAEDSQNIAGLAADLRTLAVLKAEAIAVSSGKTEQDDRGTVTAIAAADVVTFRKNLAATATAKAVKIGALLNRELVAEVVAAIARTANRPTVLDPVLAASGGGLPLLDDSLGNRGRRLLLGELMPRVDLITPNFVEARTLIGLVSAKADSAEAAAEHLLGMGAKAVLIKGGHLPQRSDYGDFLATADGGRNWLKTEFINKGCRATGCALATAAAFYLGEGSPLIAAVKKAQELVNRGIRETPNGVIWGNHLGQLLGSGDV